MSSVNSGQPSSKLAATVLRPYVALSHHLQNALLRDSRISRLIRRPLWNSVYSANCRDFLPHDIMTFMNLGYLADPAELGVEDSADIADRVSERLYDQIVGDADLAGRAVVEVGCGPGAGSAHLTRTYRPASFVGVDINKDMITWCREHHHVANLQFRQGDAQDLPIDSGSVDAVINVESSHCYPSRLRFFEEVKRVLRPGGLFLFADLLVPHGRRDALEVVNAQLSEAGLAIEDCIDIRERVLAARDAVSRSRAFRSSLQDRVPSLLVPLTEEALNLTGTSNYSKLSSGDVRYVQWRASKPNGKPTISSVTDTADTVS
jgi:SAM-dependent methyltransferase